MNYTKSDIDSMRREAMKRSQEMHNHARMKKEEAQENSECNGPSAPHRQQNNPINTLLSGMFSGSKMENDKIIIIMLIIILAKNGADLKTLIALGYILI